MKTLAILLAIALLIGLTIIGQFHFDKIAEKAVAAETTTTATVTNVIKKLRVSDAVQVTDGQYKGCYGTITHLKPENLAVVYIYACPWKMIPDSTDIDLDYLEKVTK